MKAPRMTFYLVAAVALAVCMTACGGVQTPTGPAPHIAWEAWASEVFERAEAENRIVMLDLGIEGCTACRWMREDTYADADVRRRIADHFVAVTVDAGARPDLADRYGQWAWPATIFFAADGEEVLAIRGNKRPENFVPILDDLIAANRGGRLRAEAPLEPNVIVETQPLAEVCEATNDRLDALGDRANGGWSSTEVRHVVGSPVEHALFRAQTWDDDVAQAHALQTLDGYRRITDPVWGGVFVAARNAEWSSFIAEKRTAHQADALLGLARAFDLTGDAVWLEAALEIDRYLVDWMLAPDGTFYSTQRDDATGLEPGMDAADYYALGADERAQFGTPPIDTAVYTDETAAVIRAYTALYVATGEPRFADRAREAAAVLTEDRMTSDGWVLQSDDAWWIDDAARLRPHTLESRPFLAAQASLALALLDLHFATGEARWLMAAERIANAAREHLFDADAGVFLATAPLSDDPTSASVPAEANAEMARVLLRLASIHGDEGVRNIAVGVVEGLAGRRLSANAAGAVALAAEEATAGLVSFTVVGDPASVEARALFDSARDVAGTRGLVHFDDNGRYPSSARASVFVCDDQACSAPISDPERLATVAADFVHVAAGADCRR